MGTSTYLIAIGSNRIGARARVAALCSPANAGVQPEQSGWTPAFAGVLLTASRIIASRPIGPGARNYANAVALLESDLPPPEMLAKLKHIERAAGRRPGRRWGDRPLDLDIVAWSGGIWASPDLTIPHPEFRERRFVLAPLVEIAPDWHDPVTNLTARQLLARLDQKRRRA